MKTLKEISGSNPFRVPEKYFEEVNRKIISSTSEAIPASTSGGLLRKLRPILAVAASLAFLILLSYAVLKVFVLSEKPVQHPGITMQEFTDEYLNDIDILTLEENADHIASYDKVPDVSNSEIIEYLLVENINLSDIYEIL